jgi:hypothetical protein
LHFRLFPVLSAVYRLERMNVETVHPLRKSTLALRIRFVSSDNPPSASRSFSPIHTRHTGPLQGNRPMSHDARFASPGSTIPLNLAWMGENFPRTGGVCARKTSVLC